MRRSILAATLVAGLSLGFTACSSGNTTSTPSEKGTKAASPAADGAVVRDANADLVIWADDKRAVALKEPAEKFGEAQGIKVAVQAISKDLQTNFVTANQAGNGPDVVLGAHDWIGNLVQNSAIVPMQISPDAAAKLSPIALKAVRFNGQSYGAPYAVETIALYRNNKLTTAEPKSMDELISAAQLTKTENPLCLPVGTEGDAYHMEPLLTSVGGYLFKMSADGSYDAKDMGVGQPGSIVAAQRISELSKAGVLKTSIDTKNNISLFNEGKCPFLVSGPWAMADLDKANMDYEVMAIPGFSGAQPAKPFTGVQSMFVASKAKNATTAQAFVTEALTSETTQMALYKSDPRSPALVEVGKKVAAENPKLAKFSEFAEQGDPMPNIKEMAAVWQPLGKAYAAIVGGADPESTIKSAGEAINKALAG